MSSLNFTVSNGQIKIMARHIRQMDMQELKRLANLLSLSTETASIGMFDFIAIPAQHVDSSTAAEKFLASETAQTAKQNDINLNYVP